MPENRIIFIALSLLLIAVLACSITFNDTPGTRETLSPAEMTQQNMHLRETIRVAFTEQALLDQQELQKPASTAEPPPQIQTPDVCLIAYNQYNDNETRIHLIEVSSGNILSLTPANNYFIDPAWSPDGRQLAYSTQPIAGGSGSEYDQIHIMNADSSGQRQVTNHPNHSCSPAWSPNGKQIAFEAPCEDPQSSIYVINIDGSGERQLTTHAGMSMYASWSPDGRQIAFVSAEIGIAQISVIDLDGSNLRQLTTSSNPNIDPAWSPDGKHIAFVSAREGEQALYIMDADGGNERRISQNIDWVEYPSWSPDGKQIVFVAEPNDIQNLYVINADGSNLRQLTFETSDSFHRPVWAPVCNTSEAVSLALQMPELQAPSSKPGDPTPGFAAPPAGAESPAGTELIQGVAWDRDAFHCVKYDGPTTLTITAQMSDVDRGLAIFWRLVDKRSNWTTDWEHVSMQRKGSDERIYTFNANTWDGLNNFYYPPGMGESWFQVQFVTRDGEVRSPIFRSSITFFPCAQ